MTLLAWILGFIPGILWLIYVYRKDKYEPEPIFWVLLVFVAGAVIVFPVGLIESAIAVSAGIVEADTTAKAAAVSWVVAGLIEEGAKLAVVLALIVYRSDFDEPMDGIVYAAAVALGFASAENAFYINKYGAQVILIRGPLTTAGHMLFSSIWGFALGKAKFDRDSRMALLVKGFVLSAFFHGLYNFLLFTRIFAAGALYLITIVMWRMLVRMIKEAQQRSPFANT